MEIIEIKRLLHDKLGQKVEILYLDGQQAAGHLRGLESQSYVGLPDKDYLWVVLQDDAGDIRCYHRGIKNIEILP